MQPTKQQLIDHKAEYLQLLCAAITGHRANETPEYSFAESKYLVEKAAEDAKAALAHLIKETN